MFLTARYVHLCSEDHFTLDPIESGVELKDAPDAPSVVNWIVVKQFM